jgi:N-carbamoyl-L-amino-acid hydrolase
MSTPTIEVDIDRLIFELEELAMASSTEPPAVTRIVYSEADRAARTLIKELCARADLEVREDPIGNLFARWEGNRPDLPSVATGSHIDAIPHSGHFDGTVGVLGAIEAIRALKRWGYRPDRPIELLMFTSEEPTRFGVGCFGSRALAGTLTAEGLGGLRDSDGRSLDEVRRGAGFSGSLGAVALPAGRYSAFVELHIEQGPILERERVPIGVVEAIAAPASLRAELEGDGGHAGTVLMRDRKDALCGAAELVLAVEEAAASSPSPDTVATTGVCRVHPGAINSIPSRVTLEIDVRDIDAASRDEALARIEDSVARVAARRGLRHRVERINQDPPARAGDEVIAAIEAACEHLGLARRRIVSRAYHDALFMARVAPTGMIFIPCRGGVSHRPEEYASPEQIRCGVEVLAHSLARLAAVTTGGGSP